jgi:Protein of unknown function (DUF3224)
MRARRSTFAIGVLSVAAITFATVTPAMASASTPSSGGGTLLLGPPTLIWEHALGSSLVTYEDGSLGFAGTVTGTGTIDVLALVSPAGTETFVAQWSAQATVDGKTGVLHMSLDGTDNGTYSGSLIAYGSGKLAGIVGTGHFIGQDATGAGTYTLTYRDL